MSNKLKIAYQTAMVERERYVATAFAGIADGRGPGSVHPDLRRAWIYSQYPFGEGPCRQHTSGVCAVSAVYERPRGRYTLAVEREGGTYAEVALEATDPVAALAEAVDRTRTKRLAVAGRLEAKSLRPNSVNDWYGVSDAGVFVPTPDGGMRSVGSSYARALAALGVSV